MTEEKGLTFIDVLAKISEEICLSNEEVQVEWDHLDKYFSKMSLEFKAVNSGDIIKIIRKSLFI